MPSMIDLNNDFVTKEYMELLERYETLSAATREGIWEIDFLSGKVYYNEGIQELLGYTVAEMADNDKWWRSNIHPRDRKRIISGLDNLLESNESVWGGKYQFRCADGSYKLILDRLVVTRDENQNPLKLTGTMQDYEELNVLHQELYESRIAQRKLMYKAVLEAEEKEKMYLSDSLNENTNQVLAAISMHIGQARQYVSPEGKKWLEEANKMLQLSISGIYNIAQRLSPASLHLLGIKDALDHMLADLQEKTGVLYELDVSEEVVDSLDKTESMIFYRIAQYQFANIQQHSTATEVIVTLERDKEKTRMTIIDNGDGVEISDLKYGQGFSNIVQRTENFDGIFSLESNPGVIGFTLSVAI